ncbi:hypothetical protein EHE19_011810 [Ruminiclostridium herbifermentans]|jgi:hypothetical protein|uniref:Uncharacterized protein n=1 Tax=Ruminiclostridium herbifermentans TaxID=2488810 RepID=A0A4U7J6K8_9FIRM|nr:hypothetical protein [Ruminiclostridium herbifermentans]QNU65610.1 hypothetical protein EHE19_011810 [Ruminiclostridium herbifermentans]
MRMMINRYNFQALWNRMCMILTSKGGELKFGEIIPDTKRSEMKIGKTLYIVNSRYNGKENIIDKFKRLITRKLESQSKEN